MPRKKSLKAVTEAPAGAATATATMPPPPATSSEAAGGGGRDDGAWSDAPHDAPPAPDVAQRVKAIARSKGDPGGAVQGVELLEWPPADATPAWLAGREEALAGGPVEFNPNDEATDSWKQWRAGWEAGHAEVNAPAAQDNGAASTSGASDEDEKQEADAASSGAAKGHPEGHFDLFHGIPADESFEEKDVSNIESQALAILGQKLIDDNGEFRHLRTLTIRWFWRRNGGAPSAKVRFGAAQHPDGFLRDAYKADWLVWLSADHLRNARPTKRQVEACLFHQLAHAGVTSKGKLTVIPHQFEGFPTELQRYGAWNSDLVAMLEAAGKKPSPEVVQGALNLDGAGGGDGDDPDDGEESE
jgi:putative metallopeptidase